MTPASRLASWTAFHLNIGGELRLAHQQWKRSPDSRSLLLHLKRMAAELEAHLNQPGGGM